MSRTVRQRPTCPRCGHAQDWTGLCKGCTEALVRMMQEHTDFQSRTRTLRARLENYVARQYGQ